MENKRNDGTILLLLLVFFAVIKFFSASPCLFISMDGAKYLKLAENLPSYVLFNRDFYISHPPFYPFVIKLLGLIMPAHIAGAAVSQVGTLGFMITGIFLLKLLKVEQKAVYGTIIFLSFSHLLYYWSNMIYKETFFTFIVYLFVFAFAASLIRGIKGFTFFASAAGFLAGITSDLVIFLFPVSISIILLYGRSYREGKKYKSLFAPPFFILAGYGIWILCRWFIYANNIYYPAGVDGLIEKVGDYRLVNLLTPRNFQWTREITAAGLSLNPFHYMKYTGAFFNLIPPFHVSSASISWKEAAKIFFFYLPLAILMFYGIFSSLRRKEKPAFLMAALSLSFLAPVVFGISDPRFSIPVLLPAGYFISKGLCRIKIKGSGRRVNVCMALFLAGFALFWVVSRPHFFGVSRKVVELKKTSWVINALQGDGIMAQFGYPPEIAYLTGKRVICLPLKVAELERQIQLYNISYIVFGAEENNGEFILHPYGLEVVEHVKNNPQRFAEICRVREDYLPAERKEEVYIYEIKR